MDLSRSREAITSKKVAICPLEQSQLYSSDILFKYPCSGHSVRTYIQCSDMRTLITWWMEILSVGRGLSNDGLPSQQGWVLQRNSSWVRERSLDLGHWSSDYQNMIQCPYSGASLVNEGFNLLSWRNYYLRYESDRIIMATETAELILKQGDLHVDTRHTMNTILPVRVIWTHHWPFILTNLSPNPRTRSFREIRFSM